jgi:hypothetical protein
LRLFIQHQTVGEQLNRCTCRMKQLSNARPIGMLHGLTAAENDTAHTQCRNSEANFSANAIDILRRGSFQISQVTQRLLQPSVR